MTYTFKYIDNEIGIIIETKRKTFNQLIDFIKESILDNDNLTITTSTVKIERIDRYNTITTLVDGSGKELLDLMRVADYGLD